MPRLFHCPFWLSLLLLGNELQSSENTLPTSSSQPVVDSYRSSLNVGGHVERIFRPSNNMDDLPSQDVNFLTGLGELRMSLSSIGTTARIRGHGSRWSLSNAFYNRQYAVKCDGLNYIKVGMETEFVETDYQDMRDRLVLVQAGVRVRHVNDVLTENQLSILTSGSADHQRLVGAISTETHLSNFKTGPMSTMVRAVHILLGPEHEVLIQGEPIFTEEYATTFLDGAELITDKALLDSVTVGIGSMGLIHAMIIEAVPLYVLERQTQPTTVGQFRAFVQSNYTALSDLGYEGYGPGESMPHIVYMRSNPFKTAERDKSITMTVYRVLEGVEPNARDFVDKKELFTGEPRWDDNAFRGVRVLANPILSFFLSWLRFVFRYALGIISDTVIRFLEPSSRFGEQTTGYHAEFFRDNTRFSDYSIDPFPGLDYELSLPADRLADAFDVVTDTLKECPFVVRYVLMRIATPADAILSTAAFAPLTAYMDVVAQADRLSFTQSIPCTSKVIDNMDASGIPYRMHLGKYMPEDAEWFLSRFGADAVDAWKAERRKLLNTPELRERFASEWLEAIGLHEP